MKKVGNRAEVWDHIAEHTSGGLRKSDLALRNGKIVSIKASNASKRNNNLNLTGTRKRTTRKGNGQSGGMLAGVLSNLVSNLATDAIRKITGLGIGGSTKSIHKTLYNKIMKKAKTIIGKGNYGGEIDGGFIGPILSILAPFALAEGAKLIGLGQKKNGGSMYRPQIY